MQYSLATLQSELEKCRKKWLKAQEKGDSPMMGLWERMGKSLKKQIEERTGTIKEDLIETAKQIGLGREE